RKNVPRIGPATAALSLSHLIGGEKAVVHTRRPDSWRLSSETDAALLDAFRNRSATIWAVPLPRCFWGRRCPMLRVVIRRGLTINDGSCAQMFPVTYGAFTIYRSRRDFATEAMLYAHGGFHSEKKTKTRVPPNLSVYFYVPHGISSTDGALRP